MTMIPVFGPWTEHPADTDEEKRLASAQQSKTSPLSVDKEHETGVFDGSGKEPYQASLASFTCNDFVKRKKMCIRDRNITLHTLTRCGCGRSDFVAAFFWWANLD